MSLFVLMEPAGKIASQWVSRISLRYVANHTDTTLVINGSLSLLLLRELTRRIDEIDGDWGVDNGRMLTVKMYIR